MKIKLSKQKISSTMLISMTDVIFLLLVFLLIASNFASQSGLPVRLPGSKSSQRQTLQSINIKYFKSGEIYYNEMACTFGELAELLKADFLDKEQVVRISAEHDLPLQSLIYLMDIVRNVGFEKIFVATEPEQD